MQSPDTPKRKKWAILGHARHGKDTVAELLQRLDPSLRFISSSRFALDKVIWPAIGHRYATKEECFEDRLNLPVRKEWYDLITAYNTPDRARLASELMEEHDVYVGLRNREELLECKRQGLFDVILWVDRSIHMPPESEKSCTVLPTDCDLVIDNNHDLQDTMDQLTKLLLVK